MTMSRSAALGGPGSWTGFWSAVRSAWWLMLALVLCQTLPVRGERLPVTAFGAEEGLGHDHVRCAVRDAYDLLWFCTAVGLARFDGAAMTSFGPDDGLPTARVNDLAVFDDLYLAATEDGLYALQTGPSPPPAAA
ncbi:MAG: hypothetical protein AAGM22_21145, partial [Acidobacteriota bacterium]